MWKKDEFEIVRMDPVGRTYAHSKQNFFLYKKNNMCTDRSVPLYVKNPQKGVFLGQFRSFLKNNADFEHGSYGLHLATYLELKPTHLRIF